MKSIIIVCFSLLFINSISFAKIINVPSDIDSIQGGINLANDGDTVLVDVGTYIENINYNGKNIIVGSMFIISDDTSYISQTVIDGDSSGSVVTFENGEDSTAVLSGFTITNGSGTLCGSYLHQEFNGGGIFCSSASPTLSNLIIKNNRVSGSIKHVGGGGGGIYFEHSTCRLENVKIKNCFSGTSGGAIGMTYTDGQIQNSIIENNSAGEDCAGIYFANSSPVIYNSIIASNLSPYGTGMEIDGFSNPILMNVTIVGNVAEGWGSGIFYLRDSNPIIVNSIIYDEISDYGDQSCTMTILHSNIIGGLDSLVLTTMIDNICWLRGNNTTDPMFLDISNGDFRLKGGSPCIDAGIQDTVIIYNDGKDTLYIPPMDYVGDAPDMGAYEYGDPTSVEVATIISTTTYTLHQNYPNPFNPSTTIEFNLPKSSDVRIEVYNIAGQKVQTLLNEKMAAGKHQVEFNAQNLSSGVYFYRIEAGEFQEVMKMILIR